MELPDIGKQCEESSCKQLDFLPIQCKFCEKTFCKHHSSLDGHNCPSQKANNLVELTKNTSKNVVENGPKCHLDLCNNIIATSCPRCNSQFCMEHRIELDHQCKKLFAEDTLPKTQALVNSILASKNAKKFKQLLY